MNSGREEHFETIHDVYERLAQDGRVQPVRDDLMEINSDAGVKEARALVNRAIHDGHTTATDLARRTSVKESAISAFRNDKWKGKLGTLYTLASDLVKAVNALLVQRSADETRVEGFVSTRFAREVEALVQYAVKRRIIAAFVAPAGSGKTMTLQAVRDNIPGSALLTVTRTRSGVKSFLQLFARSIGIQEVGRADELQDAIVSRLLRSDRLIIVDECHKLGTPCLDVLREIQDEVHCPMVLAGTPSFYATLTLQRVGSVSNELMDQLYSRVGMYRDLTSIDNAGSGEPDALFTVDDIRAVFGKGHVRLTHDGAKFLTDLANCPASGGLRACRDLVQIVVDLYPRQAVCAELLNAAMVMKAGIRASRAMVSRVAGQSAADEMPLAATA